MTPRKPGRLTACITLIGISACTVAQLQTDNLRTSLVAEHVNAAELNLEEGRPLVAKQHLCAAEAILAANTVESLLAATDSVTLAAAPRAPLYGAE